MAALLDFETSRFTQELDRVMDGFERGVTALGGLFANTKIRWCRRRKTDSW